MSKPIDIEVDYGSTMPIITEHDGRYSITFHNAFDTVTITGFTKTALMELRKTIGQKLKAAKQ